jgi:adenylate kinase
MNVVLLGPPGAGKGTQARLIRDHYGLDLISTGDILRDEIKRKTPLGLQVKEIIDLGLFPADEIILKIFEEYLKNNKPKGVILDGLPRTLNQAEKIDEIFDHDGLKLDAIIQLGVDEGELIKRLSSREVCKTCGASYSMDNSPTKEGICDVCLGSEFSRRPDDEPEAIKTRLEIYNTQTKPVIDYYSKSNRLRVVNGMESVQEVNKQIESLLGALQVLTDGSRCLYSAKEF